MIECKNKKMNLVNCNCTYSPCERKGICCECLVYHRQKGQLPACYFSCGAEKTYVRSIRNFISTYK